MDFLTQNMVDVWGYGLSLLEFLAVVTGFAAVWLASGEKSGNFLVGMLNNVLYALLFYQFRLYSVMLLQAVYFGFSLYGYYHWRHPKPDEANGQQELRIRRLTIKQWIAYLLIILIGGGLWGSFVIYTQAHFPEWIDPPAYPRLDALLTSASVVGQWLLSRKYWDNWPLWIVVDLISCVLYAYMGMFFTAILFASFTLIAAKAIWQWRQTYRTYER
ncbi:MAG: nicotinamide riboside transporter PnuC [Bacteroidales bacterium]|nr:nicotinamide riboside transporter PnuC [Bacteroidales bacterium]MDD4771383.1 nicotinamide riboside transporter PnuC [Bacteroidales bacterium]